MVVIAGVAYCLVAMLVLGIQKSRKLSSLGGWMKRMRMWTSADAKTQSLRKPSLSVNGSRNLEEKIRGFYNK